MNEILYIIFITHAIITVSLMDSSGIIDGNISMEEYDGLDIADPLVGMGKDTELSRTSQASRAQVIRCSRRFTPGVCSEGIFSVWTYTHSKRNCVERLGCPSSRRTNRFRTYERCMSRCRVLNDVLTNNPDAFPPPNDVFDTDRGRPNPGSENETDTPPLRMEEDYMYRRKGADSTTEDYQYDTESYQDDLRIPPGLYDDFNVEDGMFG